MRILPPFLAFMLIYSFLPLAWGGMTWEQSLTDLKHLPFNFPSMGGHLWFMYPLIKGPYVLVYFSKKDGQVVPEYYILSKQQVIDIINKSADSWQAKDHKKPPSPDYPIKIYIERDALSKYRDKWEMLLANA